MSKKSCTGCGKVMEQGSMTRCDGCGSYMCQNCYSNYDGMCSDCSSSIEDPWQ